jgi:hypothetical protein
VFFFPDETPVAMEQQEGSAWEEESFRNPSAKSWNWKLYGAPTEVVCISAFDPSAHHLKFLTKIASCN